MRLLFVGFSLDPSAGGIERYSQRILSDLHQNGHCVWSYTFLGGSAGRQIIRHRIIDRFFLPPRLAAFARANRIDAIMCGHVHLARLCRILARLLSVPWVLSIYGIDAWAGRLRPLTALRPAPLLMSISSFTTEQAVAQGWPRDGVFYVPPVVKPVERRTSLEATDRERFTLLTVGRLSSKEQYKGHDTVIRSLPAISQVVPNVVYRIVGKGDDRERLEGLAQDLGVSEFVDFAGFIPEDRLAAEYQACDVYVMPSRVSLDPDKPEGEGFGIVFLEAALRSKPLIGPNRGGPTDIIEHGRNGYLIEPTDSQQLAQRVVALASDKELRETMGRAARQTVLTRFSSAQLPGYLEPLLERLREMAAGRSS